MFVAVHDWGTVFRAHRRVGRHGCRQVFLLGLGKFEGSRPVSCRIPSRHGVRGLAILLLLCVAGISESLGPPILLVPHVAAAVVAMLRLSHLRVHIGYQRRSSREVDVRLGAGHIGCRDVPVACPRCRMKFHSGHHESYLIEMPVEVLSN